jgi:adenylate cyclase, class 2
LPNLYLLLSSIIFKLNKIGIAKKQCKTLLILSEKYMPLNIEFKATCTNIQAAEALLQNLQPRWVGEDHQIDTYFNVPVGRLKLREGNIENALIHYVRENAAGSKSSEVLLYQHQPNAHLKALLTKALGIKTVVDKTRRIYFIDNVKFHFDTVANLGHFVEVEAIDTDDSISAHTLQQQCNNYAQLLGIAAHQYQSHSYSDMLIAQSANTTPAH